MKRIWTPISDSTTASGVGAKNSAPFALRFRNARVFAITRPRSTARVTLEPSTSIVVTTTSGRPSPSRSGNSIGSWKPFSRIEPRAGRRSRGAAGAAAGGDAGAIAGGGVRKNT